MMGVASRAWALLGVHMQSPMQPHASTCIEAHAPPHLHPHLHRPLPPPQDESGKVKNSGNVPYVHIKRVFDPETKERIIKKADNPDFIKMVEKKFPNKEAKLLVSFCSLGSGFFCVRGGGEKPLRPTVQVSIMQCLHPISSTPNPSNPPPQRSAAPTARPTLSTRWRRSTRPVGGPGCWGVGA
jgi:hypothetical protein